MKTIPLTQGKVAAVDDADFEWLSKWKWYAYKNVSQCRTVFYARRNNPNKGDKLISMHSQLLPGCVLVDHKNGDGLDNRRSNLRSGTNGVNSQNRRKVIGRTSRFKGVSWYAKTSKWEARIFVSGRKLLLGRFLNQEPAARAYDRAALKYFGEFALTNKAILALPKIEPEQPNEP